MIYAIETHQREEYKYLLRKYFQLRKQVFYDKLGWKVNVFGDEERDLLDEKPCTYLLNVDDDGQVLAGSRLIPTTQPTFLETYFKDLVPDHLNFCSPTIWESSRYCTNTTRECIQSGVKRSAVEHVAAGVKYGVENGISHYIAVVEERLFRLTKTIFPKSEILASKVIEGEPIICALWPLDEECLRITQFIANLTPTP